MSVILWHAGQMASPSPLPAIIELCRVIGFLGYSSINFAIPKFLFTFMDSAMWVVQCQKMCMKSVMPGPSYFD